MEVTEDELQTLYSWVRGRLPRCRGRRGPRAAG
jgi:hypothetical protein